MGLGGIFKEKYYVKEITDLKKQLSDLENMNSKLHKDLLEQKSIINEDMLDAHKKQLIISDIQQKISDANDELNLYNEKIAFQNKVLNELKEEVIELEDAKLLQDFGLYKPLYNFANSSEYKERLEEERKKQKIMIKNGTAAVCSTQWTVNGSVISGRKMTKGNIKQTLITFNVECENAVDKVTFSNYDSMKLRIRKLFDKLNNINEVNCIRITEQYCESKLEELALAYEYSRKKKEEKEYAREQREIQRENAKVQKELEDERRRIEKEQSHYNNRIQHLKNQLEYEENEERREIIADKIHAIELELEDLEKAIKDVDYRQANERAGYVYVISNIGAFGEGVYKIGMTRRLNPMDRIDELGGASVPFRFDVHALIFSRDAPKLETALHNAFANYRLNKINGRKEFFRCDLKDIEDVVKKNHDKTVDFTYIPIAEQYRESIKFDEDSV